MPSIWQAILALVLGVLIGLIVTQFIRLKENRQAIRKAMADAQMAASLQVSKISLPKLGPTLDQRMNLLLMGVDSNGRNTQRFTGCRSDTMIIASLDPKTRKVSLVSIPRDSRVDIPGHGMDKINAAHAFGGADLAVKTVQETFSVPIDHYVVIDVQGLRKVFEALGPIQVLVEKKLHYDDWAGHLHVALEPGWHTLSPEQAEEYVRFRHDAYGDIGRIQRQQWFLRQVSQKLKEPQVWLKLPQLFQVANDYVITDLSVEDMMKLANFGKDVKQGQVVSATLPGHADSINGGSYWIPDMDGAAIVLNRLTGTPLASTVTDNLSPNSAYAATAPELATTVGSAEKLTVNIRYPKGFEQTAKNFEAALTTAGYRVKYRIQGASVDCQHEQIIQTSYKADDVVVEKLRDAVPNLSDFPVIINPEQRSPSDLLVVVTATTVPPAVEATAPVTAATIQEPEPVEYTSKHRKRNRHRKTAKLKSQETTTASAAEPTPSESSPPAETSTPVEQPAQSAPVSESPKAVESPPVSEGSQ